MTDSPILKFIYDSAFTIENARFFFDFLFYFVAGILGTFIREAGYSQKENEKNQKHSLFGNIAMSTLSAVILFMFSMELVVLLPKRAVFGISVLFSIVSPTIFNSIKNGSSLKLILRNMLETSSNFLDMLQAAQVDNDTNKNDEDS